MQEGEHTIYVQYTRDVHTYSIYITTVYQYALQYVKIDTIDYNVHVHKNNAHTHIYIHTYICMYIYDYICINIYIYM